MDRPLLEDLANNAFQTGGAQKVSCFDLGVQRCSEFFPTPWAVRRLLGFLTDTSPLCLCRLHSSR